MSQNIRRYVYIAFMNCCWDDASTLIGLLILSVKLWIYGSTFAVEEFISIAASELLGKTVKTNKG